MLDRRPRGRGRTHLGLGYKTHGPLRHFHVHDVLFLSSRTSTVLDFNLETISSSVLLRLYNIPLTVIRFIRHRNLLSLLLVTNSFHAFQSSNLNIQARLYGPNYKYVFSSYALELFNLAEEESKSSAKMGRNRAVVMDLQPLSEV